MPRTAGCEWRCAHLLPLNVGPRPTPLSAPTLPLTESTSLKRMRPCSRANKLAEESPAKHVTFAAAPADDESGLIGCGVAGAPAPAAPGRGPGSVAPLLVTACPTVWVGSLEPGSLPPTSGPCEHPSSPDTFSSVLLRIHCSCRPMGDQRGPTRCDDFPLALRPPALTRVLRNQRM